MQSLCFSLAPILRCESLSSLQSGLLIIPTVLEFIVSTSLVFIFRRSGRKHLLLVAEGWMYLALVLVDSLSGIIPAVRDNVAASSIVDTVIASTSFLPILFYLLFLFLVMRADFIVTLPTKFQSLTRRLLVLCIPLIIALNEIASFVGISRSTVQNGQEAVLTLGFTRVVDQRLWTFFTNFTLAILTAFQAITFSIAFYRLVKVLIDQRHIETSSIDAVHLVKGTGWITAGLKLGAIETVIGFAQCGFGGTLTRRTLRLFSRFCIVVGVVKGIDSIDDFKWLKKARQNSIQKSRPSSSLREIIADPRFNAFKPVSQVRAELRSVAPIESAQNDKDGIPMERVTVQYEKGQAPTLLMRFSFLDMPTPAVIEETFNPRPAFERTPPSAGVTLSSPETTPTSTSLLMRYASGRGPVTPTRSFADSPTVTSESTPQFPNFPQHAMVRDSYESPWMKRRRGPINSKYSPYPAPPLSPVPSVPRTSGDSGTITPSVVSLGRRISVSEVAPGFPVALHGGTAAYPDVQQSFISLTRSNTEVTGPPPTPTHARASRHLSSHDQFINIGSARNSSSSSDIWTPQVALVPVHEGTGSQIQNDLLQQQPSSPQNEALDAQEVRGYAGRREVAPQRPPHDRSDRERTPSGNLVIRKSDWVRFKTVGNVPRKYTHIPAPIHSTRASVVVEPIPPSPGDAAMVEKAQIRYNRPLAF